MSLHRNDYLVSTHQAELHRQAADARLAMSAKATTGSASKATTGSATERRTSSLRSAISAARAAIRPLRHAATDAVKQQSPAPRASGRSHS